MWDGAGYLGEKRVVLHHLPDLLADHHPHQLQRERSDTRDRVPSSEPCVGACGLGSLVLLRGLWCIWLEVMVDS